MTKKSFEFYLDRYTAVNNAPEYLLELAGFRKLKRKDGWTKYIERSKDRLHAIIREKQIIIHKDMQIGKKHKSTRNAKSIANIIDVVTRLDR